MLTLEKVIAPIIISEETDVIEEKMYSSMYRNGRTLVVSYTSKITKEITTMIHNGELIVATNVMFDKTLHVYIK